MSHSLTHKQLTALQLMMQGETHTAIAKKLKLRRETLSRWKHNPKFLKESQRLLRIERHRIGYRLMHIANHALCAIESDLQGGYFAPQRSQIALNVLKMLGIDQMMPSDDEDNDGYAAFTPQQTLLPPCAEANNTGLMLTPANIRAL